MRSPWSRATHCFIRPILGASGAGRCQQFAIGAFLAIAVATPLTGYAQPTGPGNPYGQRMPPGCMDQIARLFGNSNFDEFINKCWLPSAEAGNLNLPPNYAGLSFAIPVPCVRYTQNFDTDWRKLERCLLITIEENPRRLPNLERGTLQVWGQSTSSYNCYAYAVDPVHPTNWVGPRARGFPSRPTDIIISGSAGLKQFFESYGWTQVDEPDFDYPLGETEERVILYANDRGGFEHAAYVNSRGIFAKMGELGVFRFSSLEQMVGPAFGHPAVMLSRTNPLIPNPQGSGLPTPRINPRHTGSGG
jgi:hypothetical protein